MEKQVLQAYHETRKYLGYETEVAPIPEEEIVNQLKTEGYNSDYAREAVETLLEQGDLIRVSETVAAIKNGSLTHVEEGVRPARSTTERPPNESGSSEYKQPSSHVDSGKDSGDVTPRESTDGEDINKKTGTSHDNDGWRDADFTNPESDVWASEWVSRRFWMGGQGKMPFAPWASRDHPEADGGNAQYKWSITDNWVTKDEVDEWVEKDRRVDGYVVLLEKEDDPYTDNPDPYAFVDGDDVRCPETGEVHPEFVELLDHLGMTYADISTSGSGVHALYEGALPDDVKQANFQIDTEPWGKNEDPPSVEIYDGKHVCVVTGEHVPGTPEHVYEWEDEALDDILNEHLDEADRVESTEGTDTDTQNPLDGYEPEATEATETTDELNDILHAVENLTPHDLPLCTRKVGEDATGWGMWDPSTYRQSSGNDSLHSPPGESVFYDHKKGRSFGLLSLYAVEQGILTKPWETLDGSDWWEAVEAAREDGAPIPKYESNDSKRHDVFDTETIEEAGIFENHTERKRHLRKRGKLPSTPEVRRRIDETVKDRMKRGKTTVVDTPTSSGKSYAVAATPWTGYKDVTDGQPVIHLHKTKEARREAYEESRDAGVETRELVGRKDERRGCPIARGDLDGDVELDGVAPSRWIDAECKNKGLPFSLVHAEAVHRIEERNPELLDDLPCPDCPPVVQHEGVPRNDDGNPSVDVIHATHQFAYVSSYLSNCNVVVDEQPDYAVDLTWDRIRRAVTAYLKEVNAPLDTFERLLVGRGNEHLEVGSDVVEDALDREPSRSWYFDCDDAHALAPALARAVWYARDTGNQRKKARVYHEPPRFDEEDGGGVGVYVTLVLDETPDETDDATVWVVPNFGAARSVLGLDARPSMEMWQLNTKPNIERVSILNSEERRNWRFYERGLRVVQVGDATRPAGKDGKYFDEDGERAVIQHLVERFDDEVRTAGTAKAVEDALVEILQQEREKHGHEPEDVETLHYGREKSRNIPAFEGASVGYVTHCIDPGDGPVLDAVAARGLNARPEHSGECGECNGDGCHACDDTGYKRAHGRGFVGEDADKADDILGSVRENHVAQMVGRYARNPEDDEISVVFVRTDAVPDDLVDAKVKDVVWTFGEKQRAVKNAVEELDSPTAREIRDEVRDRFDDGVTKRHVVETLGKLEVCGYAERDEGAGAWGADLWGTTDKNGITETGIVDLGRKDTTVQEIMNSDVWGTYTWEFVNFVPTCRVDGSRDGLDASRPDTGGVDPGGNMTLDAFGAD